MFGYLPLFVKKQKGGIMPYIITTFYGKNNISVSAENTGQLKTPWLKNDKPYKIEIEKSNGEKIILTLTDTLNKAGKKVLTAFKTFDNFHFSIVYSYGTDDTRPSFAGTISIRPVKNKKAVA